MLSYFKRKDRKESDYIKVGVIREEGERKYLYVTEVEDNSGKYSLGDLGSNGWMRYQLPKNYKENLFPVEKGPIRPVKYSEHDNEDKDLSYDGYDTEPPWGDLIAALLVGGAAILLYIFEHNL